MFMKICRCRCPSFSAGDIKLVQVVNDNEGRSVIKKMKNSLSILGKKRPYPRMKPKAIAIILFRQLDLQRGSNLVLD